jgi:hypothetical protein
MSEKMVPGMIAMAARLQEGWAGQDPRPPWEQPGGWPLGKAFFHWITYQARHTNLTKEERRELLSARSCLIRCVRRAYTVLNRDDATPDERSVYGNFLAALCYAYWIGSLCSDPNILARRGARLAEARVPWWHEVAVSRARAIRKKHPDPKKYRNNRIANDVYAELKDTPGGPRSVGAVSKALGRKLWTNGASPTK